MGRGKSLFLDVWAAIELGGRTGQYEPAWRLIADSVLDSSGGLPASKEPLARHNVRILHGLEDPSLAAEWYLICPSVLGPQPGALWWVLSRFLLGHEFSYGYHIRRLMMTFVGSLRVRAFVPRRVAGTLQSSIDLRLDAHVLDLLNSNEDSVITEEQIFGAARPPSEVKEALLGLSLILHEAGCSGRPP